MKQLVLVLATTVALAASASGFAADGKEIYVKSCAMCHANLSPKLSDKAAWAPRLKLGTDAMVASVIKGKGSMPPRGGKATLSDDEIKAAVEYMESQVK